jgi:hypothetical protein
VDEEYQEPVQQAAREAVVTVLGQVKWTIDERLRATLQGVETEAEGYILFRRVDLRAKSITELKMDDRFIMVGVGPNARAVDLYIVGLRFEGHYTDQGGAALVKAFFKDRDPSRQSPGVA